MGPTNVAYTPFRPLLLLTSRNLVLVVFALLARVYPITFTSQVLEALSWMASISWVTQMRVQIEAAAPLALYHTFYSIGI